MLVIIFTTNSKFKKAEERNLFANHVNIPQK